MDTSLRYNYYDILEVGPHSPHQEITLAYERAKSTYSGENPAIYTMFSQDEAREMLGMVEEAYTILGNKTLRAIYDEKLGQGKRPSELSVEAIKLEGAMVGSEPSRRVSLVMPTPTKVDPSLEREIANLKDWDGNQLKKVREYRGFTIERVSEITKVSAFYVGAIERMEPQNLPAVVYVRGYVAQLAKLLGLNEKIVCESYMKNFKKLVS